MINRTGHVFGETLLADERRSTRSTRQHVEEKNVLLNRRNCCPRAPFLKIFFLRYHGIPRHTTASLRRRHLNSAASTQASLDVREATITWAIFSGKEKKKARNGPRIGRSEKKRSLDGPFSFFLFFHLCEQDRVVAWLTSGGKRKCAWSNQPRYSPRCRLVAKTDFLSTTSRAGLTKQRCRKTTERVECPCGHTHDRKLECNHPERLSFFINLINAWRVGFEIVQE